MRKALSPQVLSALIGSIYDCAVVPGHWQDTLNQIRLELGFANAAISLTAIPSGEPVLIIFSGAAPIWIERASTYGPYVIDQWGGPEKLSSFPLDKPAVLSRVRHRSEWADNRFYREWGRPQGLHDVMALFLARDATMIASIAMGRHESMGEIGDGEVAKASLLLPHLQRAVAISRLLDMQSVAASTFEATLDLLSIAVVITDDRLRIVHANAVARAMLNRGATIRSQKGVLVVRPAAVEVALGVAVRQAAENETNIGRRGFGIAADAADGTSCVLHVLPLRHGALRSGLVPGAVAAIFISSAASPPPTPIDALAALFDLTPAEARVFDKIAAGLTRQEVAAALGIESTTVKGHLSHIFAKTNTRRQADLVALNASVALPIRE